MVKGILQKIKELFFSGVPTGAPAVGELLLQRRLKRSAVEAVNGPAAAASQTAGKIFLAGLALLALTAPFHRAFAAGFLTISSFSGHPGTIEVRGGGFQPGDTINIYLNDAGGAPAAKATADKNSLFGPVKVAIPPNAPQGPVSIIGKDSANNLQASNTFYVVPYGPAINLSAKGSTPGSGLVIGGQGFAPGETVNLSFGSVGLGSIKADGKGGFAKFAATIPDTPADTYLVHAKGESSGAETTAYFYVGGFYPAAQPSAYFLKPGQKLTFSGENFAPGESIQVFQGENQTPAATITANKSGGFTNAGGVIVPPGTAAGSLSFELKSSKTGAVIPISVSIGSFTGLVKPDNYFVAPGQSVKFYGKGFAPNEKIQVYEGQGLDLSPITTITADKNGGFANEAVTAIAFAAAGNTVTFKFVGQQSNAADSINVSVAAFNPQITPSEYYLTPGKSFTIWGTGFAPKEPVRITAAGTTANVVTDKFGVFKTSGPFIAPYASGTPLTALAVGQASGATANLNLSLGTLHPLVSPDSYYIAPGDEVKLSGYGFAPGEDVALLSGSDTLATVPTDKYGDFTNQLVSTPFAGGQDMKYKFIGAKSGAATDLTVTIAELHPLVHVSTYYATPGSVVQAQAVGFSKGEPVTVRAGDRAYTTNADKTGTTPWLPITMPFGSLDKSLNISFSGDATNASSSAAVGFSPFNPQAYPSSYYAPPGADLKFHGYGFASHEDIAVAFNDTSIGTTTASTTGEFAFSYKVPLSAKGSAHYTFTGTKSGTSIGVDVSLASFNPLVFPSAYYAAPGSAITFNGSGFAPGETVSIALNNAPAATVTADSKGKFKSSPVNIPYGTANSADFTFTGSVTGAAPPVAVSLAKLNATVLLNPYYASAGVPLTVTGIGFGSSEKVSVAFDGAALGTATADAKGGFTLKTAVPAGSSGSHTVTAAGSSSGVSASAEFTIAQNHPSVQLGAYNGSPKAKVIFIGNGFLPHETVNVATDRTGSVPVHTITADAKGSFKDSGYAIPASFSSGQLVFTITGTGSQSSTTITYYVAAP